MILDHIWPTHLTRYCAPELLTEPCRYSNAVDVWSAGIVLIQLLVGSHPFSELKKLDFNKLDKKPKKRDLVLNFQIEDMPTYSKIPAPPRTLLSSMMIVDSTKRVKAKDALSYEFIARYPHLSILAPAA